MQNQATELRETRNRLALEFELQMQRRQTAETALAKVKEELRQLNFNNTLLRKIRAARPIIADKLWNTVLSSVSVMFSQMRGDQSVVSKDSGGFKVNGAAVESLSGSTLDLLGLALRVSLTKTFLPHTSFIVLDEPFAACDDGRTAAMLGFLASCGFTQTIIVSHEEATEAAADKFIDLSH